MAECGANAAGFDAALNAAPDAATLSDALDRLRPGGRFALFSGFTSGEAPPLSGLNRIHYCQLTVAGAYGCTREGLKNALQILAECPTEAALLVAEAGTLADGPALLPALLEGRGPRRVIRPG
jgi:D-arabinose 1-dehydrogenase-like Zn-dependent alcohol dehydrogenase